MSDDFFQKEIGALFVNSPNEMTSQKQLCWFSQFSPLAPTHYLQGVPPTVGGLSPSAKLSRWIPEITKLTKRWITQYNNCIINNII